MTAKRGCPRPISGRVLEAVEVLERVGPAKRCEVLPHMSAMSEGDDVSKYLRRAVGYGFAEQIEERPAKYRAVANWREILKRPADELKPQRRPRPCSVWHYAAIVGA